MKKEGLIPLTHDDCFRTLQGEGPSIGKPSVFLRLAYCNLSCEFCDTKFSWNPEYVNNLEKPNWKTPEEIATKIFSISEMCKRVVITGGEPLLFKDQLQPLLKILKDEGYFVEIETNGTLLPYLSIEIPFLSSEGYVEPSQLFNIQYNVSPKLGSSKGGRKELRINLDSLKYFATNDNAFFKFVITKLEDWCEVERDILLPLAVKFDCNIPKHRIFIMPEGQTPEELSEKRIMVMQLAENLNVNYTDRLHIIAYGKKRGV
jgi:organic radical activating enzyme